MTELDMNSVLSAIYMTELDMYSVIYLPLNPLRPGEFLEILVIGC